VQFNLYTYCRSLSFEMIEIGHMRTFRTARPCRIEFYFIKSKKSKSRAVFLLLS